MKNFLLSFLFLLVSNASFAEVDCDYSSFQHASKEKLRTLEESNACELGASFMKVLDIKSAMEECRNTYSADSVDKAYTSMGKLLAVHENGDMEAIAKNYRRHRRSIEGELKACLIGVTRQILLVK